MTNVRYIIDDRFIMRMGDKILFDDEISRTQLCQWLQQVPSHMFVLLFLPTDLSPKMAGKVIAELCEYSHKRVHQNIPNIRLPDTMDTASSSSKPQTLKQRIKHVFQRRGTATELPRTADSSSSDDLSMRGDVSLMLQTLCSEASRKRDAIHGIALTLAEMTHLFAMSSEERHALKEPLAKVLQLAEEDYNIELNVLRVRRRTIGSTKEHLTLMQSQEAIREVVDPAVDDAPEMVGSLASLSSRNPVEKVSSLSSLSSVGDLSSGSVISENNTPYDPSGPACAIVLIINS